MWSIFQTRDHSGAFTIQFSTMLQRGGEVHLPDESLLETWISADRLARYRSAPEPTSELYLWNAELSAAYFELIGHVEVFLRNVFHSSLYPLSDEGRWYLDSQFPFTRQADRDISTAVRRATANGKTTERPGKVIAELSFGFWRFLLSSHYSATIWPKVSPGFKGVPRHERSRSELETAAKRINDLRNRVAHHEPVYNRSSARYLGDIYLIARYVDVQAEEMLRSQSKVPSILERRPRKASSD